MSADEDDPAAMIAEAREACRTARAVRQEAEEIRREAQAAHEAANARAAEAEAIHAETDALRAELATLRDDVRQAVEAAQWLRPELAPHVLVFDAKVTAHVRTLARVADGIVSEYRPISSLPPTLAARLWAAVHNRAARGEVFANALALEYEALFRAGWTCAFDDATSLWIHATGARDVDSEGVPVRPEGTSP